MFRSHVSYINVVFFCSILETGSLNNMWIGSKFLSDLNDIKRGKIFRYFSTSRNIRWPIIYLHNILHKPSVTTIFAAISYVLRYPHFSTRGNYQVSVIKKYPEKIICVQIKTHIKKNTLFFNKESLDFFNIVKFSDLFGLNICSLP